MSGQVDSRHGRHVEQRLDDVGEVVLGPCVAVNEEEVAVRVAWVRREGQVHALFVSRWQPALRVVAGSVPQQPAHPALLGLRNAGEDL